MARCCGGNSCSCVIDAGEHVTITGTGSSGDPFIVNADIALEVTDNVVFDLSISGNGTSAFPWNLEVDWAATATLDSIPDVNAPAPTNGQVLSFDTGTSKWIPAAPTTAPTGAVTHDTSLAGDGSVGTPLQVQEDPARLLATTASGLGLSDTGMNQTVRSFANSAARTAATPAPELNTISTLDTAPGQYDYWDGAAWTPIPDRTGVEILSTAILELSGPYTGQQITMVQKNVSATTDGSGDMDILTAGDLSGRAGVLTVQFQETGSLAWRGVVFPNTTKVSVHAFRLLDGSAYTGQLLTGTLIAWVY